MAWKRRDTLGGDSVGLAAPPLSSWPPEAFAGSLPRASDSLGCTPSRPAWSVKSDLWRGMPQRSLECNSAWPIAVYDVMRVWPYALSGSERVGIEPSRHPAEPILPRQPILQGEEPAEKALLGPGKTLPIYGRLAATQDRTQSEDQDFMPIMKFGGTRPADLQDRQSTLPAPPSPSSTHEPLPVWFLRR
jgi:hypothetical protein